MRPPDDTGISEVLSFFRFFFYFCRYFQHIDCYSSYNFDFLFAGVDSGRGKVNIKINVKIGEINNDKKNQAAPLRSRLLAITAITIENTIQNMKNAIVI